MLINKGRDLPEKCTTSCLFKLIIAQLGLRLGFGVGLALARSITTAGLDYRNIMLCTFQVDTKGRDC